MTTVSLYFYAGDFADVMRRYSEGRQQIYQTHNENARLIYDLAATGRQVNVFSFVTPERRDECVDGVRVRSLGAENYAASGLLAPIAAGDDAEEVVIHFPNLELLGATVAKRCRVFAIQANSNNRHGIRSTLGKWKMASMLNNPRIELVSNHCLPATEQLAEFGVNREKLIPWDILHPVEPASHQPKTLTVRPRYEAAYVGAIIEDKGVGDLIRAVALLRKQNIELHCSLAGLGDIDSMEALGATLGVSDLLSFVRLIGNTEAFKLMLAADVVVVPSRTVYPEGFPLTMFEALASRTPIVCSNHPMFRKVMVDRQNASVFRSGDRRAFASAIRRTLTDPVLYSVLSQNAPKTWEALKGPADWRMMIYKWVVEGPASPWIRERMLTAIRDRRGRFCLA